MAAEPPPLLGQHARQVPSADLQVADDEVDALEREGVIACR